MTLFSSPTGSTFLFVVPIWGWERGTGGAGEGRRASLQGPFGELARGLLSAARGFSTSERPSAG